MDSEDDEAESGESRKVEVGIRVESRTKYQVEKNDEDERS